MPAMVEVRGLTKTFQTKEGTVEALKGIDLTVEKGDIYGIIGMSGAGKSTLVRCLNYLEKPSGGEVVVDGKPLSQLSNRELREERKKIAMIFQGFNLMMQRTVLDNVCFPLVIHGMKKSGAREKGMMLLETVGLTEKAKSYPAQLSGGQQQRVAIARALANDPKFLLCDEATSALDPQTTASILSLLKEINEKMGITIILITHQMSVVQEICNRVAIIEDGKLVENGTVSQVFEDPRSEAGRMLVIGNRETGDKMLPSLHEDRRIRIVFQTNSSYEPVIANMVLQFKTPVNILLADTRNVNGTARGEMILGLPEDKGLQERMIAFLRERNLIVTEVPENV
ncbi:MAG: ATP-binding cassette domain-containing protein [Lachnospiraceae bacterium]|nr:ATP-binding cassette domain-containing protein [Lachnospiraceae bacterium]